VKSEERRAEVKPNAEIAEFSIDKRGRPKWDAGLATGENLSRLYLCRGAFRQIAAVYGAGNQGRSARQFGYGLQARHAQFPVREFRLGHDGSGWNSGTDQSDRRNGKVLIDPDE
jgi:hypothetical protein